jgi:Mor family transcriptional regulator
MRAALTKIEREIVREFAGGLSVANLVALYRLDRLDIESIIRKAMRAQNQTASRPFWYRQ